MVPVSADSIRAEAAPYLPQSCGCEGRPSSTKLLTVSLKNLLDELVHHLCQVLKRGRMGEWWSGMQ